MKLPRVVTVVGPTASGKTAMGVVLARAFDGEVLCADSRTIYEDMDIGTAKPIRDQRERDVSLPPFSERPFFYEGIAHWGMNLITPDKTFTASEFQAYADKKIGEIHRRKHLPMLVGGTGLYVQAVLDRPSFANVPPQPDLRLSLATISNAELLEEIAELDPETASRIDGHNRRRLERAIEILRVTGKRLADVQKKGPERYESLFLGVSVPRDVLFARIEARVDEMIAQGLVDEVRRIREHFGDDAPGMSAIGYRQIGAFLRKEVSLKDAILTIKQERKEYS